MISYQSDNITLPKFLHRPMSAWLKRVADCYKKQIGDITYVFCDDEKILEVNREFLHHDYFTDIITFDYDEGDVISGDIFISLDTVKSNSMKFYTDYEEELHRVIVHGVLHLCGINDKGPGERELMEAAENKALRLFNEK